MFLDTTRFPLVYLKDNEHEHESPEGQILALLARGESFVLITDHLPSPDHDHGESHEDRKQRTLFFKRQKQRIRDLCVGGIVITGEKTIPAYVRIPAQTVGKAFGLELTFVSDEAEAIFAGRNLLQKKARKPL